MTLGKLVTLPGAFFTSRRAMSPKIRNRTSCALRRALLPHWKIRMTAKLADGTKIDLSEDPLDDRILADLLGRFEPLFYPENLKEFPAGQWILDVGAHHGAYAAIALARYPGARLIAVEPDPQGFAKLRRNVQLNHLEDRIELVNGAIADAEGQSRLIASDEGSWGNYIDPKAAEGIPVKTLRLDSILKGRSPYLVKTNCEGGEFALIPQLFALNLKPPYLILLAHPQMGDIAQLRATVEQQGYRITPIRSTEMHTRWLCELPG